MKSSTRKIMAIAAKFEQKLAIISTAQAIKFDQKVKDIQWAIVEYAKVHPAFKAKLDAVIRPPWGQGANGDIDGLKGPRTTRAFQEAANILGVDPNNLDELHTVLSAQRSLRNIGGEELQNLFAFLKQKIMQVYAILQSNTQNFTRKLPGTLEQLSQSYIKYLSPEYPKLKEAQSAGTLGGLTEEFMQLDEFFRNIMKASISGDERQTGDLSKQNPANQLTFQNENIQGTQRGTPQTANLPPANRPLPPQKSGPSQPFRT